MEGNKKYQVIFVKSNLTLFLERDGGRSLPVKTGYSPNHKFGNNEYYIGEIDYFDDEFHDLGETNKVLIKFIDTYRLEKHLKKGGSWHVTEGKQLIGKAEFIEIICKQEIKML